MYVSSRRIVVASGFFDPLNGKGHITYIQEAKKLGDYLIVILDNDTQLRLKKGKMFYPAIEDRLAIISEMRSVDQVVVSIDTEGLPIPKTLTLVKPHIFAKGGDRIPGNIPECELEVCRRIGCKIVYNVGDEKTTSSQELVKNYVNNL